VTWSRRVAKDPTTVGFNSEAAFGGRIFHVQTEVINRSDLTIRTTVHEGGVVRSSISVSAETTAVDTLTEQARKQHETVVAGVRRGEVD
jgi:hypothetical protein